MTTAIILAGGMGTRLRSAVPDLPKPMAPIHNRPFLEHQMDYWLAQGVSRFIISVGYMHEVITGHFGSSYRGVPVSYAVEEAPLGTGGGFLLATKQLSGNEPFIALNGDTFFEVNLAQMLDFHNRKSSDWTFALARSNQEGRYMAMGVAEDGKITSLKSGAAQVGSPINSGVYLINPKVLQPFSAEIGGKFSLEDDIFARLMAQGAAIYGLEFAGNFIDIGIPDDYYRADKILPN